MSKHTPGPWVVDGYEISPKSNMELATCSVLPMDWNEGRSRHVHGDESEANAKLIAAAPDLLEALDRLTKWVEVMAEAQTCEHTGDHPIAIARAALIKALTGESK